MSESWVELPELIKVLKNRFDHLVDYIIRGIG